MRKQVRYEYSIIYDVFVFRVRHGGEVRGIAVADAGNVRGAAYLEGELVFAAGHHAALRVADEFAGCIPFVIGPGAVGAP